VQVTEFPITSKYYSHDSYTYSFNYAGILIIYTTASLLVVTLLNQLRLKQLNLFL